MYLGATKYISLKVLFLKGNKTYLILEPNMNDHDLRLFQKAYSTVGVVT